MAALIQQHKNGDSNLYHVSLRSDGEIDVAAIAASFGGGGHASAAGFSIQTTLPDLKHRIFDLAKDL